MNGELLLDEVDGCGGDVLPVVSRELVLTSHDLALHAAAQLLVLHFRVERWISAQHDVNYHTQRPHITALNQKATV